MIPVGPLDTEKIAEAVFIDVFTIAFPAPLFGLVAIQAYYLGKFSF